MILAFLAAAIGGGCGGTLPWPESLKEDSSPFQEEIGVPIMPFSGLEGGVIYAIFPDEFGIQERVGRWFGSAIMGGEYEEYQFMLRLTYRQWARVEVEETEGLPLLDEIFARVNAYMIEVSFDVDLGALRVGVTGGGGWFLFRHRFERELAPAVELGAYFRLVPVEWFYIEGGATGALLSTNLNQDEYGVEPVLMLHASAGVQLRF